VDKERPERPKTHWRSKEKRVAVLKRQALKVREIYDAYFTCEKTMPQPTWSTLYMTQKHIHTASYLSDYDGVRLKSQNCSHHWLIFHPPGECEWRAVVVIMMPAVENS
jgi:hypothetical protein